ncbi:MAG: DNA repair protein RecN [Ruminococcaceae bacterium]|nr:DNA repair protein RecN [Oscillospiraceae bacterium]
MLSSLHIENIAVIKQADIDFTEGFNVLTGETGAGKSILIDSINLLLGARPSKDMIRSGENRAVVSALFTDVALPLSHLPETVDIAPDEDGCLYVSRIIGIDGKSQTKCNGRTIPVSLQKELMPYLINIHGQNDNRLLMSPVMHIDYLDSYAGNTELLAEYTVCYRAMEDCRRRMLVLKRDEREKARLLELLRYQVSDIDAAKLKPGEEEELEARREKVKNAEKIQKQTRLIARALYRSEKSLPAYELVKKAITALQAVSSYVPDSDSYLEKLTAMTYDLEEIGLAVADIAESEYDDPDAELDRIETRLDQIAKLERKYGSDIEEVLAFRERAAKELSDIELSDEKLEDLRLELVTLEKQATELAGRLTAARRKAADTLEKSVVSELAYLEMPKVRFRVEIRRPVEENGKPHFSRHGLDEVEFMFSANPGEPLKPMAKIASGGELSRIMLALKTVNMADVAGETMIFDEIDTGVSGKTSQKIGMRLRKLASHHQVICVTHAAQIAAEAHAQYLIRKTEIEGRVETTVSPLEREGRIRELARIMGGVNITDKLLSSAAEMLDSAGRE